MPIVYPFQIDEQQVANVTAFLDALSVETYSEIARLASNSLSGIGSHEWRAFDELLRDNNIDRSKRADLIVLVGQANARAVAHQRALIEQSRARSAAIGALPRWGR